MKDAQSRTVRGCAWMGLIAGCCLFLRLDADVGWAAQGTVVAGMLLVAVAASAIGFERHHDIRHRLAILCIDGQRPRKTSEMLDLVALRLAAIEHRAANIHPISQLPTREELLERIALSLTSVKTRGLLGLLHFVEFDQLAAFDQTAAYTALAKLAERIKDAVRDRHFVSQVDRATFAIWFSDEGGQDELAAIAYVVRQQLRLEDAMLTPSIKTSCAASPGDGANAEHLLARATANLTLPAPMQASAGAAAPAASFRETFRLEQDLSVAIEQEQLALVFQPVVEAPAGRVIGAEALLRWTHPTLGPIPPARFIPMVERLGFTDRFGLWVLNAACREASRWRANGLGELRVAVNLSAQQVLDADLETKIYRTLLRHGLAPSALELELTETAAMADAGRTLQLFTRLRAKGIGLAIDDFGAGYSSLSYLKNLPFTKLKIDREFVSGLDSNKGSRAICKALIELGHGLDLTVLAEGAETREEVEALLALGCTVIQGFYFSRPLMGDDFIQFAKRRRHSLPPIASIRVSA